MMNKKPMFDFVIGNPPYQEPRTNTSDAPIYHHFMEAAYRCANVVETITPGRFLFNAGKTPKEWNEKMLADEHLKVVMYEQDSSTIFPTTDIKGGVTVILRDKTRKFGAIGIFTHFPALNSIMKKVKAHADPSLNTIMHLQLKFNLPELYKDHPELKNCIGSEGKERRLTSNIFDRVGIFTDTPESPNDVQVLGIVQGNKRVHKYISCEYIDMSHKNLNKYKVLVPKSNGSGAIGEVLSTPLIGSPLIGSPLIGYTFSFIGIGAFDTKNEAENAMKYIKSKFTRTMLGVLKITQDNLPDKWEYVPLQNFTEHSDIDWSQSVADIDKQLYTKYGLSQDEIDFIESHVKEME